MDDVTPPNASGIYKITCTVTKKFYIGSALNLLFRQQNHFSALRRNKHHNPYLQRAWNKYGPGAFIYEIVELVLPIFLTAREQYWLDKLKPFGKRGFNIAREAESVMLGRKHTPEAREKMRLAQIDHRRNPKIIEKMRQAQQGRPPRPGRKHTPEAIEKMRQAQIGRKHTPEHVEKVKQAQIGKRHTPEAIERRLANPNIRGRKPTPEAREKMRLAHLGKKRNPEIIEKMRQANLGRKHTPEHRENIRQAKLARRSIKEETY